VTRRCAPPLAHCMSALLCLASRGCSGGWPGSAGVSACAPSRTFRPCALRGISNLVSRVRVTKCSPHPYAICAIWLLGTILPFAFLTILGDASADAFGATAIVSMVPGNSRLGTVDVLALYILRRWLNLGSAHQQHRRNASVKAALTMRDLGSYFWG
jgi:hypothetical protein